MRYLFLICLLLPCAAHAQTPPADSNSQAMGQEIMDCTIAKVTWRAQFLAAQAELAKLKAEMEKLKPPPAAKPE